MSTPDSSFYRLFRRSRSYHGPADDDDSVEAKEARKERERFAAAALVFCLKHDEEFRRSFWTQVCRLPDDPAEMPTIRDEDILLEPPRWADVRLISDTPAGRYVWVIEVKAGAPLDAIQDPREKKFHADGVGYGALFTASEANRNTRMRYIVLGPDEALNLPAMHKALPIALRQSYWADVAKCTASKLVLDLFDSFGVLGIHPFTMNKAKSLSVTHGLSGIGEANDVLMAVYEWLGVKPGQRNLEVYPDSGGAVAGISVKQPPTKNPSKAHGRLRSLTDSDDILAWLGYFASADDKITRTASLYCKTAAKREQLLKKVKLSFPEAEPDRDEDYYCVVVEGSGDLRTKDLPWFLSVFEAAGVVSK